MMKIRILLIGLLSAGLLDAAADLKKDFIYLHPAPGSASAGPETPLVFRLRSGLLPAPEVTVKGPDSGPVTGTLKRTGQADTYNFIPDRPFKAGEPVTVTLRESGREYVYSFKTCTPAAVPLNHYLPEPVDEPALGKNQPVHELRASGEPAIMANGVSVPGDFPYIEVMTDTDPAPGKIFLNNWNDNAPYIMIFNHDGTPYWYRRTVGRQRDFKVQENGLLSARYIPWINGIPGGAFLGYDSTYAVVDTFLASPGYEVDEHELRVLENGHYLLIALQARKVDMSQYFEDGRTDATINFTNLEEFDADGNLLLHFDTQEKLNLAEATTIEENIRNGGRFPHMNAIDVDTDGNLIISCRHTSSLYKINRQTGEVIWKLGGINSDFTFVNDPLNGPSGQHYGRVTGENRYIMFDNGNQHDPRVSRAVEYEIDTTAMTATMIWEYRHPDGGFSHYMGNAQRLANGNTLINWAVGNQPKATEVTPDGIKVYEMNFAQHVDCYRTQKYNWDVPETKPYFMIESGTAGSTLLFNQFGDPDVDYYKIYHGTEPDPVSLLDTSRLTMKTVTGLENRKNHYFRVTSVSKTGEESDFSNQEVVFVKNIDPGENAVLNSHFDSGMEFWTFGRDGDAVANYQINDGVFELTVSSVSYGYGFVYQYPMELKANEDYVFEFDAWGDSPLRIQPLVIAGNSGLDYARIGEIQVRTVPEHYRFEFSKRSPATTTALVAFTLPVAGTLPVDNVSLTQVVTSSVVTTSEAPAEFRLNGNYPNPFNNETTFSFTISKSSRVSLTIYSVLGQRIRPVTDRSFEPGTHKVRFSDPSLSSGIYFYRMEAETVKGGERFESVQKMILMK